MKKANKILLPLSFGFVLAAIFLSGNKILRNARKWLGVQEIGNNAGFNNPIFERKIKAVGFLPGFNYCSFFVKMVLKDAINDDNIVNLITGSSRTTFENLKISNKVIYFTDWKKAKPGDLVFYKWVNSQWRGHVDIFNKSYKSGFTTISANSPLLNGGQGVALRYRASYSLNVGNFKLLGFIRISN